MEKRQDKQEASERLLEARARRAATFVGLRARKSRSHVIDNEGHFQLFDRYTGEVKAGHRYELTAEDVLWFCRRWPEESKFDLGASQRYYNTSFNPGPTEIEIARATVTAMLAAAPPPPLQLEMEQPAKAEAPQTTEQAPPAQPDIELEEYRSWGFPNGRSDLELVPRPDWIHTFEDKKVCEQLGYKSAVGVRHAAQRHGYPPEALRKGLITDVGIRRLQKKEHIRRRNQQNTSAESQSRKKNSDKSSKSSTSFKQVSDKI